MIKVEQLANHWKRCCALHVQSKGVEVRAVDGHVTHPLPHVGGWSVLTFKKDCSCWLFYIAETNNLWLDLN